MGIKLNLNTKHYSVLLCCCVHVHTCQQMLGFLLPRMYWVRGEGSSSYLSKGKFSTSRGGTSVVSNITTGLASRGGWRKWEGQGVGLVVTFICTTHLASIASLYVICLSRQF